MAPQPSTVAIFQKINCPRVMICLFGGGHSLPCKHAIHRSENECTLRMLKYGLCAPTCVWARCKRLSRDGGERGVRWGEPLPPSGSDGAANALRIQNLHTRTRPITPTTSTQPTHRHTHEHAPHTQRAALTMHTLGTRGRHAQLTAAQTTQPALPHGLPPLALPHGPPHEAPLPGEARRAAQACHRGGGRQQAEAGAARRLAGHPARQ